MAAAAARWMRICIDIDNGKSVCMCVCVCVQRQTTTGNVTGQCAPCGCDENGSSSIKSSSSSSSTANTARPAAETILLNIHHIHAWIIVYEMHCGTSSCQHASIYWVLRNVRTDCIGWGQMLLCCSTGAQSLCRPFSIGTIDVHGTLTNSNTTL